MKKLFVLNCGSSTIKYKLFDTESGFDVLAEGIVERIGEEVKDYETGFVIIEKRLQDAGVLEHFGELDAAAHRVVHGGEHFTDPVRIDAEVIRSIEALIPLAPLHNPHNLEGIKALRKAASDLPQVAVFDTAFHQSMPEVAYRYAIDEKLYHEEGIRRFGFHGISHHYLRDESAKMLKKSENDLSLITLHLGSGASMTAIKEGKSIDTSMGFTPLEGLVMGTRPGDLDPGVVLYLSQSLGYTPREVSEILNHKSGLAGICGQSDMREILQKRAQGDAKAAFAFDLFCYRIRKYLGAYLMLLGRVDAVVFSGGIGAHSSEVREAVCKELAAFGIELDPVKNASKFHKRCFLNSESSRVKIIVMETDEELQIARQSQEVLLKEERNKNENSK
jgi:acetate kinase